MQPKLLVTRGLAAAGRPSRYGAAQAAPRNVRARPRRHPREEQLGVAGARAANGRARGVRETQLGSVMTHARKAAMTTPETMPPMPQPNRKSQRLSSSRPSGSSSFTCISERGTPRVPAGGIDIWLDGQTHDENAKARGSPLRDVEEVGQRE
jgi:hypothetical protein